MKLERDKTADEFAKMGDLIGPPRFHYCATDICHITDMAFQLRGGYIAKFITVRLRGSKMKDYQGLYNEFGAALQFPYYFGENWNAFDECIKDLSWLYAPGYVLIINDADQLLTCLPDPEGNLQSLVRVLKSAGEELATPIDMSCAWGRPSKPFHVIFQTDEDKTDSLLLRLKAAGCKPDDISAIF